MPTTTTMASFIFPFLIVLVFISFPSSFSQPSTLSVDYYKTSCPNFQQIVRETVTTKQMSTPTTAAGTLRLFFHDCMVEGCDGSVLISSNSFNKAERDAEISINLPGDAFDVVVRAKTALELTCPKTVSCSDILAQAARDLVTMVGGPFYNVVLGRKDGLVSNISRAEELLPRTNMTIDQIINLFKSKGLDLKEMVALMGAHTIGFAHCKEFADRLYRFNKNTPTDPDLNPKYATALKAFCANYTKDDTMSAFNDVLTPGKFDNMYYQNLQRGLALLSSDTMLVKDPRTKPIVDHYALNQSAFFEDFARSMEKLSVLDIKNEKNGEIRHRCDLFNALDT